VPGWPLLDNAVYVIAPNVGGVITTWPATRNATCDVGMSVYRADRVSRRLAKVYASDFADDRLSNSDSPVRTVEDEPSSLSAIGL